MSLVTLPQLSELGLCSSGCVKHFSEWSCANAQPRCILNPVLISHTVPAVTPTELGCVTSVGTKYGWLAKVLTSTVIGLCYLGRIRHSLESFSWGLGLLSDEDSDLSEWLSWGT